MLWALIGLSGLAALAAATQAAEVIASERAWARHRAGRSITAPVDAAIVLGGTMDPDGRLAYNSRRRVQAGVKLLDDGKAGVLLFTGGGAEPWVSPAAEKMRDYALELGAPAARLLVEPEAGTTVENLRFSFRIADAHGLHRLALVTDAFHLTRAWALAAWMGRGDVALVSVDHRHWQWRYETPVLHMREAAAWWYNLGKVAAWHALGWFGIDDATRERLIV